MKNSQNVMKMGLAATAFTALVFILFFVTKYADAAITSNLSVGSKGAQVSELQTYLATDATLYPEGIVSGTFGTLTEAAVKRFQARYGISQTGTVGPITRAKLSTLNAGGNGTFGDVYAPILSFVSVSFDNSSSTSATFTWVTDQPATSKIYYSTTYPFVIYTAPTVVNNVLTNNHRLVVPGLQRGVTYYYMLESADNVGNYSVTLETPFRAQ